jgi:hypothetical protein
MDQFIENFLGYKGFGPPFDSQKVPIEKINKFKNHLPDKLLEYWQTYGWSGYAKGLFWTVDPGEWEDELEEWIGDTPFMEQDAYHVIGRTAFGELILWGKKTGQSLKVVTSWGMIFPRFDLQNFARDGADKALQLFFSSSSRNGFDHNDDQGKPLFERALKKLGTLDYRTMYGFVPALALGGSPKLENLQKLDAHVHLSILSQSTERKIMRDIAADVRNMKK